MLANLLAPVLYLPIRTECLLDICNHIETDFIRNILQSEVGIFFSSFKYKRTWKERFIVEMMFISLIWGGQHPMNLCKNIIQMQSGNSHTSLSCLSILLYYNIYNSIWLNSVLIFIPQEYWRLEECWNNSDPCLPLCLVDYRYSILRWKCRTPSHLITFSNFLITSMDLVWLSLSSVHENLGGL